MWINRIKLITCLALVVLVIIGCTASVWASPHLEWRTVSVYYSANQLVLSGYFYNSGTRIIDRINSVSANVYFRQYGTNWWLASSATWYDLNVYLYPGDSYYCNLRINTPYFYKFDYWKVDSVVNYHFSD